MDVVSSPSPNELISIVMPARNRSALIGASLDSVLAQTEQNWELIVVDDGSSDGTSDAVRSYQAKSGGRIRCVRNETNFGAAASRNRGFEETRGDWIALLDSDDRWHTQHLAVLKHAANATTADVVYSQVEMVDDSNGESLGTYGPSPEELQDYPASMFQRSYVVPSVSMFHRTVLDRVGPWDHRYLYCEDFDFWLRCVAAGVQFHHVPETTAIYRKAHAGATTQKLAGTLEEVAHTIRRYINSGVCDDATLRQYASTMFSISAKEHRRPSSAGDQSADPQRAALMLIHAWRLRPSKLDWLVKGTARFVSHRTKRLFAADESKSRYVPVIQKLAFLSPDAAAYRPWKTPSMSTDASRSSAASKRAA
ncbi:MAG: glycosyltransferase [Planctomycetota bacterium]